MEAGSASGGDDIRRMVSEYYASLEGSDDLHTNACACASAAPPRYVLDVLSDIDDDILERFYGCGSPIPPALEGATVLDLGCGTGRDVYICSKLVGPSGHVIGLDMLESQLAFARAHEASQMQRFGFAHSNVTFVQSYIESMPDIPDESVDVVISNCVVNLSPFKQQLFEEVFRVLKPGGELYFSDIFSDRRVPEHFYDDPILRGECLSGALYIEDFRHMLARCGIGASYDVVVTPLEVGDFRIETKLGCIGFASHTVRAVKVAGLESREEDYGQVATYLGTMPENPRYFDVSEDVRLIKGRPVAISGNMAAMLAASRYARHVDITPKGQHVGPYKFEEANSALQLARGTRSFGLAELEAAHERLGIRPFAERVHDKELLATASMQTMQVNVGYRCNLSCNHCYLACGPAREECMSRETMQACLDAFAAGGFRTLDITGGAPELNPDLAWFIEQGSALADEVIVRSNACILLNPAYAHFKELYARYGVTLVVSLPYFDEAGTDEQRGQGSFARIIEALRQLNELGYGRDGRLRLDIVYNVDGPFLPPDQADLEDFYRFELAESQGVHFDALYAFNNYCLGRFAVKLARNRKLDEYLALLAENYNGAVVARIMCRTQVNVDYDGALYDCEVNHVLGLPIEGGLTVHDIVDEPLAVRRIQTSPICYSCAAGCGSSCGGSLLEKYAKGK